MSNTTKPKIVFFGNERLATAVATVAPSFEALIKAGYKINIVITNHKDPVSHQGRDLEIGKLAKNYQIPVLLLGTKIPLKEKLLKHPAEAAVLVAFGKIIPQEVIDLFPKGIINIHPSLLPELRGPTPIETAILDGRQETGVSLMKISTLMDAGPVYAQKKITLKGNETKAELANKLNQLGAKLLIEHLPNILNGSLKAKVQNESKASYTKLIKKEDGLINCNKSALQIEREVRAYAGWPKSRLNYNSIELIVLNSKVEQNVTVDQNKLIFKDNKLLLGCNKSTLNITKLQLPGKKPIDQVSFYNGYKNLLDS